MKSYKIIIIGSNGQLGHEFINFLKKTHIVFGLNKNDFNLENFLDFENFLREYKPDIVINCAAIVNLDFCEKNVNIAYRVNSEAPIFISALCKKHNIKFIHFSSDYVFDGLKDKPYIEEDKKSPLSVYGKTKDLSEIGVIENNPNALVFRICWVYSEKFKNNFYSKICEKINIGNDLSVVDDQFGTPTSTRFIVTNVSKLFEIKSLINNINGIYHLSPSGYTSWYEFAINILKREFSKKILINRIKQNDFKSLTCRPSFSALDSTKFFQYINTTNISWIDDFKNL
jgi:dTDP-4-dehydrorhamnose reductase